MDALMGDTAHPLPVIEAVKEEKFDERAKQLAAIGSSAHWKVLQEMFLDRIDFYQKDLAGMDITSLSLAKVGEKYLVCSLVSMELQGMIDQVNIHTEAIRESRAKS